MSADLLLFRPDRHLKTVFCVRRLHLSAPARCVTVFERSTNYGTDICGSYGYYLQVNARIGLKVLHRAFYSDPEEALASENYEAAVEESRLNKAIRSVFHRVPLCYGPALLFCPNSGVYRACLVLQHLNGKTVATCHEKTRSQLYSLIRNLLRDRGITYHDLHSGNLMTHNGQFYLIDFSPGHVTVHPESEEEKS